MLHYLLAHVFFFFCRPFYFCNRNVYCSNWALHFCFWLIKLKLQRHQCQVVNRNSLGNIGHKVQSAVEIMLWFSQFKPRDRVWEKPNSVLAQRKLMTRCFCLASLQADGHLKSKLTVVLSWFSINWKWRWLFLNLNSFCVLVQQI